MKDVLCENVKMLLKSKYWLEKSFEKVSKIDLNEEEYELFEALANRFGRCVDILINRVLRSLDLVELEDINKKLDIVIRAEKRGFVDNYELLIEMKNLRNELVNEYIEEELEEIFIEILEYTPKLFDIINKTLDYIKKEGYCDSI
ncbi:MULTISPECIES: hypothetical protein [unclassified Lebetimonas]|uniref:hypothetical protein n=1 Tax=unclassified Lebetimonas TaxID=2648158 RepID=UPI0004652C71|nr:MULTISPECIES: hypothetical protein [unclassified Lebetimonas]